jgi:class 3 adenylate cyclase/pimeloyl-ACP methyl ester carboxylesterase
MRYPDTPTKYVHVDDAQVAYKVVGDSPQDLVYFYGLGSHVEYYFDDPFVRPWIAGLTSMARLVVFDRRGTGASDRVPRDSIPTWEDWADDLHAVLDGIGSSQAAIFAALDAGPIAILFAAKHPERVNALILANTSARFLADVDYPIGATEAQGKAFVQLVRQTWGTEEHAWVNPSLASDALFASENVRRLRAAATPANAAAQYEHMLHRDVRPFLSLIQAPTLVLHTTGNPVVPPSHGRFLANHIPGARFVEFPGMGIAFDDGSSGAVLTEISEFLTGQRRKIDIDRCLATVLFTDIVDSTSRLAVMGDHNWRQLLDEHDRIVREQLLIHSGQEIDTTGDGFLASFDSAARAVRCAADVTKAVGRLGIEIRCGLHTGECEIRRGGLAGMTVHIAARVVAAARPSEVLVTDTLMELLDGTGLSFSPAGTRTLKGVPGARKLYALQDDNAPDQRRTDAP